MPNTAMQAGVKLQIKRTVVIPENAYDFHFFETVFVNQSHQVRIFTDIDEACSWLTWK